MLLALAFFLLLAIAGGIYLAESAVKVRPEKRVAADDDVALQAVSAIGATVESVEIRSRDGLELQAWLFRPSEANGQGVVVLHGFADSRRGMLGHVQLYLRNGFTVLAADSRGHGSSEGKIVSFGLKEVGDLKDWLGWFCRKLGVEEVYGHGQSMGAGVLLQSLPGETRWKAIVAECPFSRFREVAYERMAGRLRVSPGFARKFLWPVGESGLVYTHWRYGANLRAAKPIETIRNTEVPILLIHGDEDRSVPHQQSRDLHAANPASELWIIAGARHTTCLETAGSEFERRILDFFASISQRAESRVSAPRIGL